MKTNSKLTFLLTVLLVLPGKTRHKEPTLFLCIAAAAIAGLYRQKR